MLLLQSNNPIQLLLSHTYVRINLSFRASACGVIGVCWAFDALATCLIHSIRLDNVLLAGGG